MNISINKYLPDYELIDCGDNKKLERFGNIVLIRPEISAIEKPKLGHSEWKKMADTSFIADKNIWIKHKNKSFTEWGIQYKELDLQLKLTNFKHIGIFPEQVLNWEYIKKVSVSFKQTPNFLNLFGYTGISSLVAASNNYKVTHVEALKQIIAWGKQQALHNNITCIRWIVDDVVKFIKRENRRKNKYNFIVIDPPAIGYGTGGKRWIFEKDIMPLLEMVCQLLDNQAVIILNLYAHSMNEKFSHKLILEYFNDFNIETNSIIMGKSSYGNTIDHGQLIRLERNINSCQKL
jgi:23S rRNA (cytosine1962-C5)-methyltransferase